MRRLPIDGTAGGRAARGGRGGRQQGRRGAGATRLAGARAEECAAALLERLGYRIVGRNVRARWGEVDLVARDPGGEAVVLVEVRGRRGGWDTTGIEQALWSITPTKRARWVRAARLLAARYPGLMAKASVRFDVVAVELAPDGRPASARHLPGVLEL